MLKVDLTLGSFEYVNIVNTIFVSITKNFWYALLMVILWTTNKMMKF